MDGSKRIGRYWRQGIVAVAAVAGLLSAVTIAIGQDSPTPPSTTPPFNATESAAPAGSASPSAEEVRSRLLERRSESPAIEPVRREGDAGALVGREAVGVAPGLGVTALKREGSFVVSRRGRMVPALGYAAGTSPGWMFAFESDDGSSADAPMILMPCRLLEDMEQMAERLGDSAVMLVSGQVYVYRGANYLLPTVMRLAPDRENLEP